MWGPMVVCPPGIRFFLEKGQKFSLIDLGGFHYAVRFGSEILLAWKRLRHPHNKQNNMRHRL
jgi:hypothetical protein